MHYKWWHCYSAGCNPDGNCTCLQSGIVQKFRNCPTSNSAMLQLALWRQWLESTSYVHLGLSHVFDKYVCVCVLSHYPYFHAISVNMFTDVQHQLIAENYTL
jgi:hypothetical protein